MTAWIPGVDFHFRGFILLARKFCAVTAPARADETFTNEAS